MKKTFFSLLVLIATIGLIELGSWAILKMSAQQPDPVKSETTLFDAHRNHRLNPNFDPNLGGARVHSEDGFRRSTTVPLKKESNTIRIIAMGTSALYGVGAGGSYPPHRQLLNDETITFYLEDMLNKRLAQDDSKYSVEVINAGLSAYRTFLHLIHYNSRLQYYHPDIVINIDGYNDFYDTSPYDRWNTYGYSTTVLADQVNGRTFFIAAFTLVRALAPYSNTFNLCEKILKRYWHRKLVQKDLPHTPKFEFKPTGDFETDYRAYADQNYLRDLWQLRSLKQFDHFEHYVYLQPMVEFEDDELLSPEDLRIKQLTIEYTDPKKHEAYLKIRSLLPTLFREKKIPLTDISQIASPATKDKQLYIDYCHLTPLGAEVTARMIFTDLYPKVKKVITKRTLEETSRNNHKAASDS